MFEDLEKRIIDKDQWLRYLAYAAFERSKLPEKYSNIDAHEFFNAIQFGYDVKEKAWLKEATATWIEDEIYDNINWNRSYLTNWFRFPYVAMDADKTEFKNHWYGSWIFIRYISEHLGGSGTVK